MMAVDQILKMDNPIQSYGWGSRTALAELLGKTCPADHPQAEMWMGAHPKSPSKVWHDNRWQSLNQLIAQYPHEMLGTALAHRFDNAMPYLLKILAVAQPLSIQAHPDKQQARDGFLRETRHGIALDAANRNYKDAQHKPECICALTTFWGLCGFRSLTDIMMIIGPVWPLPFNHLLKVLTTSFNQKGLQLFFKKLMGLKLKSRKELVAQVVEKADRLYEKNSAYEWIIKLNDRYRDDIGVLFPMLLNLIKLKPGDAIFLPARQLHAYLDGLGIELMANSDNVLRGGLTPKYVDVDELIEILAFSPHTPDILTCSRKGENECDYPSAAEEFALSELAITRNQPYENINKQSGPEILLCIEGTAEIRTGNVGSDIIIEQGRSVFVPSIVEGYTITGGARLFKAKANLELLKR